MLPIILSIPTVTAIATFITGVGGAFLTIRKIASNYEKSKKSHQAIIVQLAKEADLLIKTELKNQLHELEIEVENLKTNTEKDLRHLKETYNSEIKFLGQKIQELRDEVHLQHSQLVVLLTKMLDRKD